MSYTQCFICREWGWDVSNVKEVPLCMPCYVDVLEVRQARGVMGEPARQEGDPPATTPGNFPSPFAPQTLDLFD